MAEVLLGRLPGRQLCLSSFALVAEHWPPRHAQNSNTQWLGEGTVTTEVPATATPLRSSPRR
eukprot:6004799-Lingulodinium_polyedra.AAC.1